MKLVLGNTRPSQIISKNNSFSLSQIINKKDQLLSYLICFFKKLSFPKEVKCKVHSICSLFHFLYNQLSMKIIFTSSYKTYFKDNTKNYVTSYYVLVFLISVFYFFIIWEYVFEVFFFMWKEICI